MIVDFSLRNNNIVHELIGHWKFTENVSTFTDFEDLTSSDFYNDPEELYSLLSDIVYEGQIFYSAVPTVVQQLDWWKMRQRTFVFQIQRCI